MRGVLLPCFLIVATAAFAAEGKGVRFWNLTTSKIVSFHLSPPGMSNWGRNQCENDRDGSVSHDERLKITGIEPGSYDAKLGLENGRVCIVKAVEIKANEVFSIDDKALTDCKQ
jgi:hypothetical protein